MLEEGTPRRRLTTPLPARGLSKLTGQTVGVNSWVSGSCCPSRRDLHPLQVLRYKQSANQQVVNSKPTRVERPPSFGTTPAVISNAAPVCRNHYEKSEPEHTLCSWGK